MVALSKSSMCRKSVSPAFSESFQNTKMSNVNMYSFISSKFQSTSITAVICPSFRPKQAGLGVSVTNKLHGTGLCGVLGKRSKASFLSHQLHLRQSNTTSVVRCSFSSSSNGNGSKAGKFNENDADYVNSTVREAVEVKSGAEGFVIKMRDGRHLRCVQNNPQGGQVSDYAPHPAIVLKMEDGTGLLLPIIVLEMPSVLLMAAVRNVQIARPTLYNVIIEMIDKMGYEVKLVRVTKRQHEAYYAELYLTKVGNEAESISFDLRPSDAINIAVRCKVPIQVNKSLAYSNGMRVIEPIKLAPLPASDGLLFSELDRPSGQPCIETKEFNFASNMFAAANEERFTDAAEWRDKLKQFKI